jgi:hypothetical protein
LENFLQGGCYDVKAVKVKLVKVMFSGLKNEFDHFDLDQNDRVITISPSASAQECSLRRAGTKEW